MNIYKLGYTNEDLTRIVLEKGKNFIVKYNTIYQLSYSKNAQFKAIKVYQNNDTLPLITKGRHCFGNAQFMNSLIEKELFI